MSALGAQEDGAVVRVLIVDDHLVVRAGVSHFLEAAEEATFVVREVSSADAARAALEDEPNVAILGVDLPDADGYQLCREICATHPDVACILLTAVADDSGMIAAMLAGAAAYLDGGISEANLVEATLAAARGEVIIGDELTEVLDRLRRPMHEHPELRRLTPQEQRLFELIGQGLSNRQIAQILNITEKTVKNYVSNLLSKLRLDRRTQVAVMAARLAEQRTRSGTVWSARAPSS